MDKQCQLASDYESSEDPISSDKSLIDSHSESTVSHLKPRLVKSDSSAMIDKKILVKFNSLIKTLKETRCNLVIVDQIIGRDKRRLRSNKSETSLQEMRPQLQRPSSLPPLLGLSNCQYCRGDSCQHQLFPSEDGSENAELLKNKAKHDRMCRSLQDLTTLSPKSEMNPHQVSELMKMGDQEILSENAFISKDAEVSALSLCYQLEEKEKQINYLSLLLQELSNRLKISESHRHQLLLRFEDMLASPLEVRMETEHLAAEIKRIETMASDAQLEKNRLKRRARKIVQELKEKCKHYATELQRARDHEWELEQRCNRYVNENRILLSQITDITEKFQVLFKQLDDIKIVKESVKNQEFSKSIEDCQEMNNKLLADFNSSQNRIRDIMNEKIHLESKFTSLTKEVDMSTETIEKLKDEIKEMQLTKNELQAQFLAETTIRQAIETSVEELMGKLERKEQQFLDIQEKHVDVIREHVKNREILQQDLFSQKAAAEQKLLESLKNQELLYESRFNAAKLDLAENQAQVRTLQDSLETEQEQKTALKSEILRSKEEYTHLDNRYRQLCRSYFTKKKKLKEKETKIKSLQERLLEVYNVGKTLENEFQNILRLIHDDIDVASNILLKSHSNYPMMNNDSNNMMQSEDWLRGIKSKLRWLTTVIKKLTSNVDSSPALQHTVSLDNICANSPHTSPVRKSVSDTAQLETLKTLNINSSYLFNSTELQGIGGKCDSEEQLGVFKRYERFQQLFHAIQDFNEKRSTLQPEIHNESLEFCAPSTGQISPTSSLSSISLHSCEIPITCNE